jgi:hypothetical protein
MCGNFLKFFRIHNKVTGLYQFPLVLMKIVSCIKISVIWFVVGTVAQSL